MNEQMKQVMIDELGKVLSLDDEDVTTAAVVLAFYTAMIDAAEDDPIDDPDEQERALKLLNERQADWTDTFQQLVNARI